MSLQRRPSSMDPDTVSKRISMGADDIENQRASYGSTSAKGAVGHTVHAHPVDCASCLSGIFSRKARAPTGCDEYDVVLIGGGIMSATLGVILQDLEPNWKICIIEKESAPGTEASNGWNNAGTGHAALCELNYTPEKPDGSVDISKAIAINEKFHMSRQFWSYLVDQKYIADPSDFINTTPHMTFVHGDANCDFLRRRFEALKKEPLFDRMEFSEDPAKMAKWAPLLFEGKRTDKVAMTRYADGTDVDYGKLTNHLINIFMKRGGTCNLMTKVTALAQNKDKTWTLRTQKDDLSPSGARELIGKFVFVGCGGASLQILQKSGIEEARGFGGFPISGMFLVCQNPSVVAKHPAKIYGKAAVGAPPMSVPHLDARIINGKSMILFGPYAGFAPNYLKSGSYTDLFSTLKHHNLIPMAAAGVQNLDLTIYLAKELMADKEKRMASLREFIPDAKPEDWQMTTAGQRVQIMKKDPKKVGILQFGTEVVAKADGSIAGLLGASPGASVAVQVALDVLATCYKDKQAKWEPTLKKMMPTYGTELKNEPDLIKQTLDRTARSLRLNPTK